MECLNCGCHTYARVDHRNAAGKFVPGPEVRCVECKTVRDQPLTLAEREEVVMQDWRWGNLTKLGVANHLRRQGFNLRVATEKANAVVGLLEMIDEVTAEVREITGVTDAMLNPR